MIISKEGNGKITIKLIDFGLSNTLVKDELLLFDSNENPFINDSNYVYYPFYNAVRYKYLNGQDPAPEVSKGIENLTAMKVLGLDIGQAYLNKDMILAIGTNPKAPKNLAWLAETCDIYPLAGIGYRIFTKIGLTKEFIQTYLAEVVAPIYENRSGTKGFLNRLYSTTSMEKIDPSNDYDLSYDPKKQIDNFPPPTVFQYRNMAERTEAINYLWTKLSKAVRHPAHIFNSIQLFDRILLESKLRFDLLDLANISIYLSKDNVDLEDLHTFLGIKYSLKEFKSKIDLVVAELNGVVIISGPNTITYWLQQLYGSMSWSPTFTKLVGYVYSLVFAEAKDIINYALYLLGTKGWAVSVKLFKEIRQSEKEQLMVLFDGSKWDSLYSSKLKMVIFNNDLDNQRIKW